MTTSIIESITAAAIVLVPITVVAMVIWRATKK